MCGRFARTAGINTIIEENEIRKNLCGDLLPSFNIAPGQEVAAIVLDQEKKLVKLKWGLIPSWSKKPGNMMINARAETLALKPSFKTSFQKRRCLIISDGFYEWRKEGKEKIPVFIRMKSGAAFTFAGIYDFWKNDEGKILGTCSIITTEANSLIESIHDRMPVIIRKKDRELWLDCSIEDQLVLPLMGTYPPEDMEMYDVSARVNSTKNDDPDCIKPAGEKSL